MKSFVTGILIIWLSCVGVRAFAYDLNKCVKEDSFRGYEGAWIICDEPGGASACDLREYKNGITLGEIINK